MYTLRLYSGYRRILVRYKYVRGLLNKDIVYLDFVKSKKNIADQLTKGLSRNAVLDWRSFMA